MVLNAKKSVTDQQQNEDDWTFMKSNLRNEAIKMQSTLHQHTSHGGDNAPDGYHLISKMLNLRDNLQ